MHTPFWHKYLLNVFKKKEKNNTPLYRLVLRPICQTTACDYGSNKKSLKQHLVNIKNILKKAM